MRSSIFDFLKQVLVLKYFLQQRNLNVTFKGGVGSFLLQLMVIASIQHHAKVRQHARWKQLDVLEANMKSKYSNKNSEKLRLKKHIQSEKDSMYV